MAGGTSWAARSGFARFAAPDRAESEDAAAGRGLLFAGVRDAPLWSVVLVVSVIAKSAAALALPAAVAAGIDAAVSGSGATGPVLVAALAVLVLTVTDAGAELANAYYVTDVTAGLRNRLVRHALALGVPGRRRFAAGDVLSRLTADAARPATFLSVLITIGVSVLMLAGCLVALALIDWTLALTLLVGIPPAVLIVRWFVAGAGGPFLRYQQLQAEVVTRLLDALRGVRTIRASGVRDAETARVLRPVPRLNETGRQVWAAQAQVSWQLLLLIPMLQIAVLCVGGFGLSAGRISAGELVAAAGYVLLAVGSFEAVDSIVKLLTARIGATRVATVLSAPAPAVASEPRRVGDGRVELRGITVRSGEQLVLDHVDLTIPAGFSVAAVGRSGAGKSLLAAVMGRLVRPESGTATIDGTPLDDFPEDALREAVACAFERPALLGATIHDTIAYARPGASRAEVRRAARAAQADHFIRRLPGGYDTPLREARFSGGEVQRLGLARVMLTDARIVLLDDATSSLDTATEMEVAHALQKLLAGRTTLLVAHRAGTAARADLVAWLDGGRVRALAPHDELWLDPAYREVFGA
ncbi:ABC transporter ATP-binding protein [Saccharopolyspora taberi]|uniref:ABC transporter ATP-binding protein n=1 Tax=Saccharopolyspora taberi TaxID=60895 RepID=A0ABN3V1X7_9PSEU